MTVLKKRPSAALVVSMIALFVALGGTDWPPRGSGVAVIAGDPPKVVASLPTGEGACAVDVSPDGARAAVASYFCRPITILEQ